MAVSKGKIGIYTIAGIVAAAIIIVSLIASGIQLPSQNQNSVGTLAVSIKDAPVNLDSLTVTISGLSVQSSNGWIDLALSGDQPAKFDLLALTGDNSLKLSEQELSSGSYTKIRLEVSEAIAVVDGAEQTLRIPPEHLDIIIDFTIEGGKLTALLIDMQPDLAAISNSGNFKPILKATVTPSI